MRKCPCRTHPLDYDTRQKFEIRVTEKDCDVLNCPNNYRTTRRDKVHPPDWAWYLNPQPLQPDSTRPKYHRQSILGYLLKSLAESSINGLNKVISAPNWFQRLVWVFVFVCCLLGFGYQTLEFLSIYHRKPSVVQIEVENDGLADFPAVTLCNTNRLRKTALCDYMPKKCYGLYHNISVTEPEIGDIIYDLLTEKDNETKLFLGHSADMVQDCQFNGFPIVKTKECLQMLEQFYDPDFGNCYTIPSKNLKGRILEAREADFWQEANDLSILLDMEVDELLESRRHPGILVTVHDNSVSPDVHTDGILIGPGVSYTFSAQKSSVFLLPHPYKTNCTDYTSLPWQSKFNRRFTSRLCTVGCSQHYQQKKCNFITKNLSLFYDMLPYDPKTSTEAERICAENEELDTQDYCRSICGLPCRDTTFEITVGSTSLTEKEMLDYQIHSSLNRTWEEKLKNLALVKVYFSTLEHTIYRHIPKYEMYLMCNSCYILSKLHASYCWIISNFLLKIVNSSASYDTMELFSYLGGYSGVWLGFSLLTVYELIEILLSTARFAVQKHHRASQFKKLLRITTRKQGIRNFKKRRHFK